MIAEYSAPQILDHRYVLIAELGSGGMGVVHRVLDRLTGDQVALKQVAARGSGDSEGEAADRLALAQEFRILASLRHPNVINVLDYGFADEGQPYFTMRLLQTPRSIIAYAVDEDAAARVRLLVQTLSALDYLHRRGVIHRDLKPTNVLVEPSGGVQVLDFGLSQFGANAGVPGGTLAYMAPELVEGDSPSVAADLYAVGIIAYELFAGSYPFDVSNFSRLVYAILEDQPDWTPLYAYDELSGTHRPLRKVIARLLNKDPAQRCSSAWEAVEELCLAVGLPIPHEEKAARESFLQAANFVGRDVEMSTLQGALQQVRQEQKPQLWLIGGESGIGKSRLLEELRTIALVDGWRVLRGQSSADLRLPYQVWRAPARSLIIGSQLDDLQAAVLRSLAPDIETLIDRAVMSAADLQGTAYVQRLASTLASLLRDAAPVLLILEDLHWAGDDLDLLRQVTASLSGSPILIVGSYRSDERPDLPAAFPSAQSLFLNRLPTPQIDALAESMLGAEGHSSALVDLLERETEGNILFIIEVIRALAEEAGELRRIPQERLPARVFAGGILEAVLRRLRRLPDWATALLNIAALAGRDLDLTLLRSLVTPVFDLEAWLTACANAAVLELADQRWRFSHDKLREALIAQLPDDQFRLLHAQIAEGIQQVYPNDDQYAEALFEHLLAANEPDRAIPHGQVAARAALASSRYGDTRRIVDAVKALTGDSLETVGFDLFAAEAALYQGDYARADALCQAVLSRLLSEEGANEGDARRARALLLRARLFTVKGDYQRAAPTFQDALDQARLAEDQRGIADALFGLGQIEERQAEGERAGAHYAQCLAIYRALNDAAGIADSLHGMGGVAYTSGDHESARRAYEESLAMRRKIGDRRAIASSLNNLGGVLDAQGKKDEAHARFAESLNLRREIGERRGIAMSLLNLGHLLEDQGDLESAFAHFSESYELFRGLGVKQGIAISLINLASTWRLRGAHVRARGLLDEGLALVREMGDSLMIAHCLNGLALAALALGETPAALAASDEEIDLRRELGDAHLLGMALWTRAEILLSAERQRDSNAALREALLLGLNGGFADLLLRALKSQVVRGEGGSLIAILRANRALADLETRRWIDALPDPPSPTEAVPDLVDAARRLVEKLDQADG